MKRETTPIKKHKTRISKAKKEFIRFRFISFLNWLKNSGLKQFDFRPEIIFETWSSDDTMRVDEKGTIHFNLLYLEKTPVEYFVTIILHEAYHCYMNNIPNKDDATRVKDLYHNQMMLHIDIEADYYVAKFLKEEFNFDLEHYLSTYFSGANTFRDSRIRPIKFERFVCSMLTVAHLHKHNELAIYRLTSEAIILSAPKPEVILHKEKYSEVKQINISSDDLITLTKIYQFPDKYSVEIYVKTLSRILQTAVDGYKSLVNPKMVFKVVK